MIGFPPLKRLLLAASLFGFAAHALASSELTLDVYNPGTHAIFPVSSVLVSGEKDAILVDAQFGKAQAQQVVEKIRASGKHLTTIYISHGDPDYYFGLDTLTARLVGISLAIDGRPPAYLPLAHDYLAAPEQLPLPLLQQHLAPLLAAATITKVGQNLKFDGAILARHGLPLAGPLEDTLLQSYVLDAAVGNHDLDSLAARHLQHSNISFASVAGKGAKALTFNQIALEQAGPYAAEDALVALRLHQQLRPKLAADAALEQLYRLPEQAWLGVVGMDGEVLGHGSGGVGQGFRIRRAARAPGSRAP